MANEIRITTSFQVVNGLLNDRLDVAYVGDQATLGGPTPGYVTIGTSEEEIAFGELGTKGFVTMQNLDSTNYVEWGFSTTVYGGRMKAGDPPVVLRLNNTSVFLKANTGACKCLIKGYNA